MPTLSRISVTPVKGLALSHPQAVEVAETGIEANRRFFLVGDRGELVSGSDVGELVQVRPTYDADREHLSLTFPDGSGVEGEATPGADALLVDFYGRPVAAHVVPGPFSGALSAHAGRPLTLVRCDVEGDGSDVHHLSLLSEASVRELAARGRYAGELDSRRFRLNLELAGCEPFEEEGWDGRHVRVGDAVLRPCGQIPRCVVTTQDPATGRKDWDTLTQIAKFRPRIAGTNLLPFGMYAEVESPGSIRVGDLVEPL